MTTHQWYVTSQWYTWQNERGHLHRTPTGPAHAKTFGAATTACGIPCDSWTASTATFMAVSLATHLAAALK